MVLLSRILQSAAAAGVSKGIGAPALLQKNIRIDEFYRRSVGLVIPNYTRMPFFAHWWEVNFSTGNWLFGLNCFGTLAGALFIVWTGWLDKPPIDRIDRTTLNSAKYRILCAYYNEGKRPALKIAQFGAKVRYYYRGIDHPTTVNEEKDMLFKLRENYLIEKHPGIQYPYVHRQFNQVKTPSELKVPLYPAIPEPYHFHEQHGHGAESSGHH